MAWSHANQHTATCPGAILEFGTATIASGSVEVTTRMKTVIAAFACYVSDPSTTDNINIDKTITNGAVTITGDTDAAVSYLFIGV